MDELATAAAAVVTTNVPNADEHSALGSTSPTMMDVEAQEAADERLNMEKENGTVNPADRDVGAANPKVSVAVLLKRAGCMFPEGQGAPRAMAKDDTAAEKTNELLVNAKKAVDELWRQRGYDPKKPEVTKARLGYALDKEEAVGYVVTGAMHLPRLAPDESRAVGKRVVSLVGDSGSIGSKLKALGKRGKAAAPQIAVLLHAASALSLQPPPRKRTAPPSTEQPPRTLPRPAPEVLSTEQPCTRAAAAAVHIDRSLQEQVWSSREAALCVEAAIKVEGWWCDWHDRDEDDENRCDEEDVAVAEARYRVRLKKLAVAFPQLQLYCSCMFQHSSSQKAQTSTTACHASGARGVWAGSHGSFSLSSKASARVMIASMSDRTLSQQ